MPQEKSRLLLPGRLFRSALVERTMLEEITTLQGMMVFGSWQSPFLDLRWAPMCLIMSLLPRLLSRPYS